MYTLLVAHISVQYYKTKKLVLLRSKLDSFYLNIFLKFNLIIFNNVENRLKMLDSAKTILIRICFKSQTRICIHWTLGGVFTFFYSALLNMCAFFYN